jgi:nitrite reductase (NADH) small subunit
MIGQEDFAPDGTSPAAAMLSFDLGPMAQIPPGEGRLFSVGRRTVAVFRTRREELFATDPWCAHQGGPLADGIVGDGRVVCPLHAYRYRLETGEPEGHACGVLATFDVSRRADGHLVLRVPAACTA